MRKDEIDLCRLEVAVDVHAARCEGVQSFNPTCLLKQATLVVRDSFDAEENEIVGSTG